MQLEKWPWETQFLQAIFTFGKDDSEFSRLGFLENRPGGIPGKRKRKDLAHVLSDFRIR